MKFLFNFKAVLKFTGLGLTALYCSVNAEPLANTLPQGGTVASGNVTFSNEGTSDAPILNINQSTQKAILNWNSFDVGSKSTVNFNQPNSSSSTLNRIHSQNASEIHGRINATGEVLLVNENGILFGKDSQIDVGSIAASANNIRDEDFLKDNYVFEESDKESTVANQGNIKAGLNGYAALLAPHVINEGIVTAQKGTVAFASGNKITLKINGGSLTALTVSPSKYNALIENKYIVEAPGGQVILSATAVNQIKGGVIKQAGIINVGTTPTMKVSQAGRIVISSNHFIATSESQTLASAENQGGDIKIETTKTASIEDGA
ncbi:MAG: filamentous hemagglutinin N-terminal domain-containing protein, partial [Gammaproteobacteria bacterium]|nr:filamentous hemagglutinin N-terminal domain-containing protein [Gammaproteobacteria bacterium]